jgi:hypothetical protein
MKRTAAIHVLGLGLAALLTAVTAASVGAQGAAPARVVLPTDRTVLPIPEPQYPHSTMFDVRNATPPPRFEVWAPAGLAEMKTADRHEAEQARNLATLKKGLAD